MDERWSDRDPLPEGRPRRGSDSLEQGIDRLVTAGRQLVDGVSGARPGSRSSSRGAGRQRLGDLGRWVEDKLDWILEDEDDWREPWQEPRRPPAAATSSGVRRPLEAISRRGQRRQPPQQPSSPQPSMDATEDWPDDESFSRPRWQRPRVDPSRSPERSAESRQPSRPLPRSSRRRQL